MKTKKDPDKPVKKRRRKKLTKKERDKERQLKKIRKILGKKPTIRLKKGKLLKKFYNIIMKYKNLKSLAKGTIVGLESNGLWKNSYRVWHNHNFIGVILKKHIELMED